MKLSGMRCYRDDRNYSSFRSIIPENPVSTRRFLLSICLEDLFPMRAFERSKFVGFQRRMPEVGFKKSKTFSDGLEDILFRRVVFNLPKVSVGLGRENQLMHGHYLPYLAKDSRLTDPS
jgi:hypothetical protein